MGTTRCHGQSTEQDPSRVSTTSEVVRDKLIVYIIYDAVFIIFVIGMHAYTYHWIDYIVICAPCRQYTMWN